MHYKYLLLLLLTVGGCCWTTSDLKLAVGHSEELQREISVMYPEELRDPQPRLEVGAEGRHQQAALSPASGKQQQVWTLSRTRANDCAVHPT